MCSDKNFLVAHSIIEHEESCAEFSQGAGIQILQKLKQFKKKIGYLKLIFDNF